MKPSARSVLRGSRVRQARCLRDDQRHPNWLAGRERPSRSRSQQRGPGSRGRGWGSHRHSALPAGSGEGWSNGKAPPEAAAGNLEAVGDDCSRVGVGVTSIFAPGTVGCSFPRKHQILFY